VWENLLIDLEKNSGGGSIRRKVEERLAFRERIQERAQRMKIKRSEDLQVFEEVFDKSTLMVVYRLMNSRVIDTLHGAVKSGKEAKIFYGTTPQGGELAVKIYLAVSAEFKRGMLPYLEGDVRFRRVRRDTRSLIRSWALKEYKNLQKAYEIGLRVPKPYAIEQNVLVMEFIGEHGVPSLTLKETPPKNLVKTYRYLLNFIKTLYRKANLVHGDLSEYNVMMKYDEPVIFDMSQAVLSSHPMANQLLKRDIANLNRFFQKLKIKVRSEDKIYKWIIEK
jgi:RIO kinase 1